MAAAIKTFTRKEVAEHKTSKSVWIIFENKVYDVTDFLDDHPGDRDPLLEHAGRDGTGDFKDVGHSKDAEQLREKYFIGELAESDKN